MLLATDRHLRPKKKKIESCLKIEKEVENRTWATFSLQQQFNVYNFFFPYYVISHNT